jgi:iron complex outermembrane recepter protein
MNPGVVWPVLPLLLMFFALFASAEDDDQEVIELTDSLQIVGKQQSWFEKARSTAMKMEADDLEIPYSQSVINTTMLEDLKANSLEESYGYITGFSRSGTAANSFTIRGMAADLQNLQMDGLPGLVSRFGSPVTANIEQVEVLKGPASVLYGWMEPGGLVNIVTKKPQAVEGGSVDFTYQNFVDQNKGGYEGSVDYTGAVNADGSVMYRLIAGGEKKNSFRDYVDTDTRYFYPSVAFQLDANTRLDVQLEYVREHRNADDALFVLDHNIDTAADIETYYQEPGNTDNDEGYALVVTLEQQLSEQMSTSFKWRSVVHEDERDLYENNAVVADDSLRRRNRHQLNQREYHFFDASIKYAVGEAVRHSLLAGINGGYEYRQYDQLAIDSRGANVTLQNPVYTGDILSDDPGSFRRWNLYNAGVYLFDRMELNQHLTLVAGVRHDYQEGDYNLYYKDDTTTADDKTDTSSTNYNGGLVYRVNDDLSVYGSYSESFNPQTVATYDQSGDQLEPEQGEQYEAGFKLSGLQGRLNLSLAWFDITRHNVVENNGDYNEPVGEVSSHGVEINPQYQITDNWQVQAGYTWMKAEVSKTLNDDARGNAPAFAPVQSSFLWSRYNYPHAIAGGFAGASLGIKHASDRFTDEETSKRVRLPSYTVMDVGLYFERQQMKYALNIANITDEVYYTGGSTNVKIYPGDPLKMSLSARYEF